jgi:hypothetical protein
VVSPDTIVPDTGTVSILQGNSVTLTITIHTPDGLPAANQSVVWTQAPGPGPGSPVVQFTTATTTPTDFSGNAQITIAAPPLGSLPTPGTVIVTATTPDGKNPTATITVAP